MKNAFLALSAFSLLAVALPATAAPVIVLPATTWSDQNTSPPFNTSSITADAPRSGNGSLRVEGPRDGLLVGLRIGLEEVPEELTQACDVVGRGHDAGD